MAGNTARFDHLIPEDAAVLAAMYGDYRAAARYRRQAREARKGASNGNA